MENNGSLFNKSTGYCEMALHVILLFVTCGIWGWYWVYQMTAFLNGKTDEPDKNPTVELLLYMFIPFYSIYWIYKNALRIDKFAKSNGVDSDLSTVCLILAIFVPIVAPILMQSKVNSLSETSGGANYQTSASKPAVNTGIDIPEELQKYKELLDEGIITQEEYDAKKKQLLGL